MSENYGKDDRVHIFSNGTEHLMWEDRNCRRGERGCRRYNPNAESSRHGCAIECAVALGAATDGLIPAKIALRGGWLEPGEGGKLVRSEAYPLPLCPEFKGYDEPDDRPRRGPQPPADQLDIFDPRNEPVSVPSGVGGERPS